MITTTFIGFFGFTRMRDTLIHIGRNSLSTAVLQTASTLDQQFSSVQTDILKTLSSNQAIQSEIYFQNASTSSGTLSPVQALIGSDDVLTQMQRLHKDIVDSILLMLNNGMNFLDNGHHLVQYAPVDQPYEWFRERTLFSTNPVWIDEQPPVLYGDHTSRLFASQWLASSPTDAILVVAIKPQYIRSVLDNAQFAQGGLAIEDAHGKWLTGMRPPAGLDTILIHVMKTSSSTSLTMKHQTYWYASATIPTNGWKVVAWEPQTAFLSGLDAVRAWIRNTVIIAGAIALVVTVLFAWSITWPLRRLRRVMKEAEGGALSVQFQGRFGWEIRELATGFNAMMARIQVLMQTLQMKEAAKRELEFQILQAQMNPHFLYNTLDTMYWMSYQNKDYKVSELAHALGRFFRLTLNKGKSTLTLREELEHLENYITIQNVRYDSKISLHVDVPNELLDIEIPKLILQPLVENSILHGFQEEREGDIWVTATMDEQFIMLCVEDNGVGIHGDVLTKVLQRMAEIDEDGVSMTSEDGFAIWNLCRRCRLHYGPEFKISFTSVEGHTTVMMYIPFDSDWMV